MDNNLRTVNKKDLCEFVEGILSFYSVDDVSFTIRSFYFIFRFKIPEDDDYKAGLIQNAIVEMCERGIITEKAPNYFKNLTKDTEIKIMLIHPFNIVE